MMMTVCKTVIRDVSRLSVLLCSFLLITATVYAEVDQADFEEDFDIQRFEQMTMAPGFTTTDLDNTEFRLQDYRGKFVMLNFWASWCVPCVRELPELDKLRQALPDSDFTIIAVNVRDRESRLRKFLASRSYRFDIPLDRTGEIYRAYDVASFPTTFLIDRQGRLFGRINGARYWMKEGFVPYLKQLIQTE